MENEDELELIRSWVADQDEAAAAALIEQLHPRITRIIGRHYDRVDEFADLEQDVFLKIFKNLHKFKPDQPLVHWISRITLNSCKERWRKRSRRPELRWSDLSEGEKAAFDTAAQSSHQPIDSLAAEESRSLLLKLFERLKEDDRLVLSLHFLEEKTFAEIASILGKSEGSIRVQAHRARKKLEKIAENLKNL